MPMPMSLKRKNLGLPGRQRLPLPAGADLPYVLEYAGENCLMIGSDYGHADNASKLLALKRLKENGVLDPVVIDKILCSNPARFYGLD
jgi:predicted TIM-barrel fold metal-dependent hydrolase